MTTATRRTTRAGGTAARERLASYRRYADLMGRQEAALVAGDLEGFHLLADQALEVQGALGTTPIPAGSPGAPGSADGRSEGEISELLRVALGAGERIRARLHAMRDDAGRSVRRAAEGQQRVRGYAAPGGGDPGIRLDLKL